SILTDLQGTLKGKWRYLVPAITPIHNHNYCCQVNLMLLVNVADIKLRLLEQKSLSPQVVSAAKLPILNPNEFDLWKMRIEQYFLMTDYSLWEVIFNGNSPVPTRVIEGVVQPIAPTTAKQRLARKNELKARGTLLMALPDKHQLKFNIHKDAKTFMEAIKKRFGGNKETKKRTHTLIWRNKTDLEEQSLDDLFNSLKIYEAEPISAVAGVFAASVKIHVSTLPNLDTLSNAVIYSFFACQSNSPQLDNDDLKQIDADDLEEMDLKWQMAMLTVRPRKGYFARECRSPKDIRRNVAVEPQRRNVLVETSTSNAFVSQCDGVGSYDSSFQEKEEPTNYALMAFTSSSSSSSDNETDDSFSASPVYDSPIKPDTDLSHTHRPSAPIKNIYDRYQSGEGYHVVPPPYTRTFMPPKPDLVFHDALDVNETVHTSFNVKLSPIKPDKDLSHTHRPSTPIIEDRVSDSEDDSKDEITQHVPSFGQPNKQGKTLRSSVKPVETSIPADTHKTDIPKPKSHGNSRNRKACFVSSNFPPKVTAAKAPKVNDVKGVQGNWGNPQHALKDKRVIDSRCSWHMTGNKSYLSDFKEINGGYVAFGGNPKGGKISGKDTECIVLSPEFKLPDENQVLLKVPKENKMYIVDLKNIVPSGDLTCLFVKVTLDESNLWYIMLGHINFKTMNKLVKGNGPRWLFDIDTLIMTMNYQPFTAGNQSNPSAGVQEQFDGEKAREGNVQQYVLFPLWSSGSKNPQNTDDDDAFEVKDPEFEGNKPKFEVHVSPSSSAQTKMHDDKIKREAKGKSLVELSTGYRNLSAEFEDFFDNIINEVNTAELEDITYSDDEEDVAAEADFTNFETTITVNPIPTARVHKEHPVTQIIGGATSIQDAKNLGVLVDLPNGKRVIGTKWVFRNKKDERGIIVRNKAQLVAQGHTQKEGIDYEEVFAPVARIESIRLFLAYASFIGFMVYQMDVKSAFLYETIKEEVYVCQPLEFKDPDYPDKLYKVVKALYGLHQAPRAWYETLANYLLENGFQKGNIDQTLFIKRQKGDILLVQIYVDDIIFGSTNKDLCKGFEKLMKDKFQMSSMGELTFFLGLQVKAFEKLMKDKFQMSSMGELTFFLGIQVKQKPDGIFINRDKYVAEILRMFGLTDRKSASTLIDTKKPLLKDLDGMIVAQQHDDVADEGATSVDVDAVPATADEPSIPSPTPTTQPPTPLQELRSTSKVLPTPPPSLIDKIAQTLEITKLKQRVKKLERRNKLKVSKLRRLKKVENTQRVDTSEDTVMDDVSKQGEIIANMDADEDVTLKDVVAIAKEVAVEKVAEIEENAYRKEKEENVVMIYQALKRKPQTEAQARKNMMIYLRNMVGFKMDYLKGMSYDDIRPIFKKYFNSNMAFLEKTKEQMEEEDIKALKKASKSQAEKAVKKQKLDEEVEELKKHLQIVPNNNDDVYTEVTPLALKVHVVDYAIHTKNNKPYFKIIRADETHKLFLSFLSLLMNFNREDLEVLWQLVKKIFASSKPKNFSNDFLLTTLTYMFEEPNV
nr:putative ribonuclease H-like domain-containing protein [Tanacetum cinerariifolium]